MRRKDGKMTDDRRYKIINADCLDAMREMPADSVDAIVTDPPYALPGGFMGKSWDNFDGREDVGFGYWLAGFTDGEGCFRIQRHERGTHACGFQIKLRRDDKAVLERIRRFVGHGVISDCDDASGGSAPQAKYCVQDKAGCEALVGLFRRFPLTAKKAIDFEVWADAVWEWLERPRGNRWSGQADQSRAASLKSRLENVRKYTDIPWSGHRFQDWARLWAAECFRVAKPGAHLLAFGGTRTYHRLACAIEDAGWEIRDCVMWVYGSGFPKSHDVSKAIDKAAGAEREPGVPGPHYDKRGPGSGSECYGDGIRSKDTALVTAPATDAARQWEGWGTALKPAWEPVIVARKPLIGTVAENVLAYGTGGLNIDGCRVGTDGGTRRDGKGNEPNDSGWENMRGHGVATVNAGRWPANVIHDGSDEVTDLFPETKSGIAVGTNASPGAIYGSGNGLASQSKGCDCMGYGDSGSAARFFQECPIDEQDAQETEQCKGRWPANVIHDGSDEVTGLFPETTSGQPMNRMHTDPGRNVASGASKGGEYFHSGFGDSGSAARFFYCAKASKRDRDEGCEGMPIGDAPASARSIPAEGRQNALGQPRSNHHPTVKPTSLMRYLCRLITPPCGTVLDPFMGSGSTGKAAILEGFNFIGIDREAEYCAIAEARCAHAASLPTERDASPVAASKARGGSDIQTAKKSNTGSLFE